MLIASKLQTHLRDKSTGDAYIEPDGNAYWDSGFVGGNGCEFRFDCLWQQFPKLDKTVEYPLMGNHIYSGIVPCTFNYFANNANKDTATIQGNQTEVRLDLPDRLLGVRKVLFAKFRVNDRYLRIGFEGDVSTSVYRNATLSTSDSLYICKCRTGGNWDHRAGIMPAKTVKIFGIKILQNGTLIKDFQPQKIGGRPCFFETISQTAHFSLGSSDGKYGRM